MIKQTRASRWLQVLETAQVLMSQSVQAAETAKSHGIPLPAQAQNMIIGVSSDPIKLMTESDPPIEGTELAIKLNDVIKQARALKAGSQFHGGLTRLVVAIKDVIPRLRATTEDEIESATDLVEELERGFMLSLILSMSAHNAIAVRVEEWEQKHNRFIQGQSKKDVGHYFSMHATNTDEIQSRGFFDPPVESSFYSDKSGPGTIHMRHMIHAINSGANIMVAGGGGMGTTTYYPEAQGIEYAQWFTYMHALWDEQFRPRFAKFHSRGKTDNEKIAKNDIKSEFFNDIRKIRLDFVHHQGIVKQAAKLKFFDWKFETGSRLEISMEQMIEVMDNFPRAELLKVPTPHKQERTSLQGSFDVKLLDVYMEHVKKTPKVEFSEANDEMMHDWLVKKGLISSD